MKKKLFIFVLAVVIATGTAFADHPKGTGIGVVGFYPGGVGLSLKLPSIPIFWAVSLGFYSGYDSYFSLNVSGDYYMIDKKLGGPVHWFLGLGGFFSFNTYTNSYYSAEYSWTDLAFGARVPIGLSIQPIPLLEIFLDIAPSLGMIINGEQAYTYNGNRYVPRKGSAGFYFAFPVELGLRFWF